MQKAPPRIALLLSLALTAALAGGQAPVAQQTSPEVAAIVASALGPSPLEENLRKLTDEVGGRMSGTPAMRRAVAWAREAFRAAGVDRVTTEQFAMPEGWNEGATKLEVLAPVAFAPRAVSLGWSPAAPVGGLETWVLDAGEGGEADFARAGVTARGALLLVHSGLLLTLEDLFGEYIRAPAIIDRAVAAGAAGILWISTREHGLLYRHVNNLRGQVDRLPQALVAREDALRMARYLAAGQAVRARLTMPNRAEGMTVEENVVAEIRGREKHDEVVILGAHLDSWDLGTGALDNGCNSALVVDVARALRAAGRAPRRTVRFILFSGEEQGLIGSWAYAQAHRRELDNVVAVVIYDLGTGRARGYSLGGRADIETGVREILRPLDSWDVNRHTTDAFVGTDNFDFLLEGVPNLVANQDVANYLVNYHASSDTFDKVELREVKLNAALAAATVWGLAERPARIGRRQTRVEVEKLLQQTGVDQQMKTFGLWPEWERGARGRQQ